jgi:hypothetical protein
MHRVSKLLSISCERAPQDADDLLERQTWAAIRIYAGQRCVTRWLDRDSQQEIDTIYIPAFPLARWIAMNWWALLNEPCSEELPPAPGAAWTERERAWLRRHCFRSAESGLFLPRLSIWNNGNYLGANWVADPDEAYQTMPGPFLYGSSAALDMEGAEDTLRAFVVTVLRWIERSTDLRAIRLRDNWTAIISADDQETAFCRAAGRMRLDPYDNPLWPTGLTELLETLSEGNPSPLAWDFLAVAVPEDATALWGWVSRARDAGALGPLAKSPPLELRADPYAGQAGVIAARRLRTRLGIGDAPLPGIEEVADAVGLGPIEFQDFNHQPGAAIRGAVGWQDERKAVVLGQRHKSIEGQRFLLARGLFHATFMCQRGARLITRSHDWDQQASRGFAAEFLAPRAALVNAVPIDQDEDEQSDAIGEIAQRYHVHPELVRRQLQNAARFGTEEV